MTGPRYPTFEDAVLHVVVAAGFVPDADHAGTATPERLAEVLPFVRANRHGGGDEDGITDVARVSVDVFAATWPAAAALAARLREYLTASPHVTPYGVLDGVGTDTAPVDTPWEDPAIRRFTADYRVTARRTTTV